MQSKGFGDRTDLKPQSPGLAGLSYGLEGFVALIRLRSAAPLVDRWRRGAGLAGLSYGLEGFVALIRLRSAAPLVDRWRRGAGLAGLSYALGSCWLTSIWPTNKGGPCPPRLASRPLPPPPSASSLRSRRSASTLILRGTMGSSMRNY